LIGDFTCRKSGLKKVFIEQKANAARLIIKCENWKGWHHHVALSMLTLWFLTKKLLNQKKRIADDLATSS